MHKQGYLCYCACPPLRWKWDSNTREKMSEPFRILFRGIWIIYMKPSLLLTSSKQPIPWRQMSSSSSLKHWKNWRLTSSHTSPTSEGKSLLTTNRTLSRQSCLLVLLPWRNWHRLKENECQVAAAPCIMYIVQYVIRLQRVTSTQLQSVTDAAATQEMPSQELILLVLVVLACNLYAPQTTHTHLLPAWWMCYCSTLLCSVMTRVVMWQSS